MCLHYSTYQTDAQVDVSVNMHINFEAYTIYLKNNLLFIERVSNPY